MDAGVIAYGVGMMLVLFFGLANLIVTWQTKRVVDEALGRDSEQAKLGRRVSHGPDLDASDRAQADQAPERPAESGAHVAVAPPASAPVLAAGLGPRPSGPRSERPPPHKPPQPVRRQTLLGIHGPRLPRAAEPGAFDDEDEVTRVALGEPGSQAVPRSRPGTGTLPSMPAIAPTSARPAPTVDIVAARFTAAGGTPGAEDDGPTLKQTDDGLARG
jgi:hypothetical protein